MIVLMDCVWQVMIIYVQENYWNSIVFVNWVELCVCDVGKCWLNQYGKFVIECKIGVYVNLNVLSIVFWCVVVVDLKFVIDEIKFVFVNCDIVVQLSYQFGNLQEVVFVQFNVLCVYCLLFGKCDWVWLFGFGGMVVGVSLFVVLNVFNGMIVMSLDVLIYVNIVLFVGVCVGCVFGVMYQGVVQSLQSGDLCVVYDVFDCLQCLFVQQLIVLVYGYNLVWF